jgi:hypothetical protein
MKKRKFATGGQYDNPGLEDPGYDYPPEVPGTNPGVTPMPTPGYGGGSGGAYGGLNTINRGASQVGSALKDVSGSLGQAAQAIGGPGGGFKDQMLGKIMSPGVTMKKGGKVKGYAKGGSVASASKRGDGIAQRGKTKGRMV